MSDRTVVNGMTYRDWMRAVSRICAQKTGIGAVAGYDWPSIDMWNEGISPQEGYKVWLDFQPFQEGDKIIA
jgi:hypothetical protein